MSDKLKKFIFKHNGIILTDAEINNIPDQLKTDNQAYALSLWLHTQGYFWTGRE